MKLEKLDTSKFLYDPKDEKSFTKLLKYKDFKVIRSRDSNQIIQYIILMYDLANTDIVQEYPQLAQRKMMVARMVGLVEGKSISPAIEDILIGKDSRVNAMIIKYLHLFNNPSLLMLESYKEMYAKLNQLVMGGDIDTKDYTKTIQNIEVLHNAINTLTDTVLKGKDETRLREDLYRSIEGRGLGIRVEDIAEKLQRNEPIFPEANPYGNYKPNKMKFVADK